jgi:hypothetical protein
MLTDFDKARFATFGYTIVRGLLRRAEAAALAGEINAAQRDAFGSRYGTPDGGGGIEGHYLPMMADRTPISAALVDDLRLFDTAESLLGGPVVPLPAEGVLYFGEAGWHFDDGIGITGLKLALYLEPLTAATGALRLLPLSHRPEVRRPLERYRADHARARNTRERAEHMAAFPFCAAETEPGDAVIFDLHTWHASAGGRNRLAWTVEYLAVPQTAEAQGRRRLLRYAADHHDQTGRGFDHHRYPLWRDWIAPAGSNRGRAVAVARLRRLGVLDLPGALLGDVATRP